MATEILDEHEQGERVREWLRQNSLSLVIGLGLGLGAIFGWKWWQEHLHGQRVQEGARYQAVVDSIAADELEKARTGAGELGEDTYAVLAALDLAKAEVKAGSFDEAISTLRGVADMDPALEPVRRQRLALLLIETGEHAQAVQLLEGATDPAGQETLGDAHRAAGNDEPARVAYQQALDLLGQDAPQRGLVELKLADAGGTPSQQEVD